MATPQKSELGERLENVLNEESGPRSVRWAAEVPIVTNLFMLVDFLRFALVTMAIIFAIVSVPEWFYTRRITEAQLLAILRLCGLGFVVFTACLLAVGFLLLRNRFRATFVLSPANVYYETAKCNGLPSLKFRPSPADGKPNSGRAFSREIPWEKMDSFVGFPSMRTILLKRGLWEILKLYTPDDETYAKVLAFLQLRLKELPGP